MPEIWHSAVFRVVKDVDLDYANLPTTCLAGPYHKKSPSNLTGIFVLLAQSNLN